MKQNDANFLRKSVTLAASWTQLARRARMARVRPQPSGGAYSGAMSSSWMLTSPCRVEST